MLRWVLLSPLLAGCASGASEGPPHTPPAATNAAPGQEVARERQTQEAPAVEEAAIGESSLRPRLETARSAFGKFESKMIDEYRCKVSFVWDDGAKDTVLTTERCSGPYRLAHLSRVLQSALDGATLPNGDEFFLFGESMGGPNVEGWMICWVVFVRKGKLRVSHIKLPDVPEGRLLEGASGTVELLSESLDGLTTRPCTVSFESYRCSEQTRPCTVSFELPL
jgi:hypothetical protein